jgi:SAM-dependent methyltransferase
MTVGENGISESQRRSWQLQMFSKTLKKQQKVRLLVEGLGPLSTERCLLVTNGDNNGAMNVHFRAAGGEWTWAEFEEGTIPDMAKFLGDPVHQVELDAWPFEDASFDRIVMIDVHEHLRDVTGVNRELARVLAPGGLAVVTTPNGNTRLPVAALKRVIGMGPAEYGHVVQGYTVTQLEGMLRDVNIEPVWWGGYSRFFTEMAELAINFGYVKILSRKKSGPKVEEGTIAPSSEEQLRAVRKTFRMYSAIYPFIRTFSALDVIVPGKGGYAVAVAGRKPA